MEIEIIWTAQSVPLGSAYNTVSSGPRQARCPFLINMFVKE